MEFVYDNESILKYNIEVFQKGRKKTNKWAKIQEIANG
jgi:hypothetical protein